MASYKIVNLRFANTPDNHNLVSVWKDDVIHVNAPVTSGEEEIGRAHV